MVERNSEGREIWFDRFGWSYMPAHWKGVVYPVVIAALFVPLCLLADRYSPDLSVLPLIGGWVLVMRLCSRHSPSKR